MPYPTRRDYSRSVDPPSAYETEDGEDEYEARCRAYEEHQQDLEDQEEERKAGIGGW